MRTTCGTKHLEMSTSLGFVLKARAVLPWLPGVQNHFTGATEHVVGGAGNVDCN